MPIKLLLFGTGGGAKKITRVVKPNKASIVAYVDNSTKKIGTYFNGKPVISPLAIKDYEYDYLIIASTFYREISEQLVALGIREEKVVPAIKFLQIAFRYLLENFIEQERETETIITGISYAKWGIIASQLQKKSFNFALEMQDLYVDHLIARYILARHNAEKRLKYFIICLGYFSFEYDLALSKYKDCVYRYNRILNTFHGNDILREDFDAAGRIFKAIFIDDYYDRFYAMEKETVRLHYQQLRQDNAVHFVQHQDGLTKSCSNAAEKAAVDYRKNYPATIAENKAIFFSYLQLLQEAGITTIVVIPPGSKKYADAVPEDKKRCFLDIVAEARSVYSVQFYDFFESPLFSENDFYDCSHLGQQGAEKFSRLLNETIRW